MEYSNMTSLGIIDRLRYMDDDRKKEILRDPLVIDKFRNSLLMECTNGDNYRNYRDVFDVISLDYFFEIFDYNIIHDVYKELRYRDFPNYEEARIGKNRDLLREIGNKIEYSKIRNMNEYKLFVVLCEKGLDATVRWVLSDDNLFKEFWNKADILYSSFSMLDYELIVQVIHKLDECNDYFGSKGYEFITCVGTENQKALLGEDFKDEMIVRLLGNFNIDAISYFFLNDKRAKYLFKEFNLISYINAGVMFSDDILRDNAFFDKLKGESFIDFRTNINTVETYNNPIFIESKLNRYYDEIISFYDSDKGMFKIYSDILDNPSSVRNFSSSFVFDTDVRFLFMNRRHYDDNDNLVFEDRDNLIVELKNVTSKKLSEVIIDALFQDNIYNVWLNIREMLRYNDKLDGNLRVLDNDRIMFYKMILDIDKVSCDDKIKLFKELRDKNINVVFYDDLRKLKDISYDMIKKDLVVLSNCKDKIDNVNSEKCGNDVYDLRDSEYTMLVRAKHSHRDKGNRRRNCYSIISSDNSDTFGYWESNDGLVIYGYNSFDNDRVIHILEQDAFSGDVYDNSEVSRYVNRIATSKEISNGSSWYSEVELVNLQDENGKYDNKKPDFIVVYDEIRDIDINESRRLNIPIVIIRKTKLKEENRIDMGFDRDCDVYVKNYFEVNKQNKMR